MRVRSGKLPRLLDERSTFGTRQVCCQEVATAQIAVLMFDFAVFSFGTLLFTKRDSANTVPPSAEIFCGKIFTCDLA